MSENLFQKLLKKYDLPTPRYTSYPTVPCWDTDSFSASEWREKLVQKFDETNQTKGISLYIHLPFCESLCTYCACSTRITINHAVEITYIRALLKEWETYKELLKERPIIREIHLGGGTPTFFSPENLKWLITYLLEDVYVHSDFHFSFEGHPNNTTLEHLKTLRDLGFSRVSFGVQDLDEKVQRTIHRIQPLENLERVTLQARSLGYESVSYDLIYGLPFQTPFTVSDTFDRIISLRPDRISFYSYAHVPWLKPGQRGYEDKDLPSGALKRHLYEIGRFLLKKHNYIDIGMDHFALRHDSLFKAQVNGNLHRNFMGYTTTDTDLLIGLGASAISDSGTAYAQNTKTVEEYLSAVRATGSAIVKGHILTEEDRLIKKCILQLTCQGKLDRQSFDAALDSSTRTSVGELADEGLIYLTDTELKITTAGEPFIRNICSIFDKRSQRRANSTPVYSRAI